MILMDIYLNLQEDVMVLLKITKLLKLKIDKVNYLMKLETMKCVKFKLIYILQDIKVHIW